MDVDRFEFVTQTTSHVITYPTGTVINDFVLVFLASPESPNAYPTMSGWQQAISGDTNTQDFGARVFWKASEGETSVNVISTLADDPYGFIVRIPKDDVDDNIGTLLSSNSNAKKGWSHGANNFVGVSPFSHTVNFTPIDSRPVVSDDYHWFEFMHFERGYSPTVFDDGVIDWDTPAGWLELDAFQTTIRAGNEGWAVLWYKRATASTLTVPSIGVRTSDGQLSANALSIGLAVLAEPKDEPSFDFLAPTARRRIDISELPYEVTSKMARRRQ